MGVYQGLEKIRLGSVFIYDFLLQKIMGKTINIPIGISQIFPRKQIVRVMSKL